MNINYQNLFDRKYQYDSLELEQSCSLNGTLTNKKVGALLGSSKMYFRFFDSGKLLVGFSSEPKPYAKPKMVAHTGDISDIEEKMHGNEFLISFAVHTNSISLIAENVSAHKKWMKTLTFLSKFYQKDTPPIAQMIDDSIELNIVLKIHSEIEALSWFEIKRTIDPTPFLKEHDLKNCFDKTKFVFGKLLVSEIQLEIRNSQKGQGQVQDSSNPLLSLVSTRKKTTSDSLNQRHFKILLVSQKNIFFPDPKLRKDYSTISESNIPTTVPFNTILFYAHPSSAKDLGAKLQIVVSLSKKRNFRSGNYIL